jgi:hypothetical protein
MADPITVATPLSPSIPASQASVDELHELRVRIPVNLHRQLLSLKVLRGRSLAETVSLALDIYFAQVKAPASASPPAGVEKPEHAQS